MALKSAVEYRNERMEVYAEMMEVDERLNGDEVKQEDRNLWEDLNKRYDSLKKREWLANEAELDKERAELRELRQAQEKGTDKPEERSAYGKAFDKYLRHGITLLDSEERALLTERRDQVTNVPADGGYLTEPERIRELTEAMKDYEGILRVARIVPTTTGSAFPWPTLDDTANEAEFIAEAVAPSPATTKLTFGQVMLNAHMASSKRIPVSYQLMQDSVFDVGAIVNSAIMTRHMRLLNRTCTVGTGTGQPAGVVGATPQGGTVAGGSMTSVATEDLLHSVDPAYRGGSSFMMNDQILKLVRRIEDGAGNRIFQPSIAVGLPDTLHGYPIVINNNMSASAAATERVMLFGDFSYYIVRMVRELFVLRLNEIDADRGMVGFLGFMRYDGKAVFANTTTQAPIKHLANA